MEMPVLRSSAGDAIGQTEGKHKFGKQHTYTQGNESIGREGVLYVFVRKFAFTMAMCSLLRMYT